MDSSAEQLYDSFSLPKEIIEKIILCSQTRNLSEGDVFIKEGEKGTSFFIIQKGQIEIQKGDIRVGIVKEGDIIGESSLSKRPRNASAMALGAVVVTEVSVPALVKKLTTAQFSLLKDVIFEKTLGKLSQVNELATLAVKQNLEDEKAKVHMGRFILSVLVLVFVYVFTIQTVSILNLSTMSSSVISIPVLIVFGIAMFALMKKSGLPLSVYGFTLANWHVYLFESFLFTLPLLAMSVIIKWMLIHTVPKFSSLSLFQISPAQNIQAQPIGLGVALLLILSYVVFVPVQEMIYRGAMQSSLQHFLVGKHKVRTAILISNIPFCMIHFHLSLILVLLTYLIGLFWGWMFARQKSLVGVCFSHFLVGIFAFFILDAQKLLIF